MSKQPNLEEINYWIREFNDSVERDEDDEVWLQRVAAIEDDNLRLAVTDAVFHSFGAPPSLSMGESNSSDQTP